LITGKKKIVSIDDILGEDDLFESKQTAKVDHQKAVSKSSSGGAKNSSAPQNAKKREEPTPDSKPATKAKVDEIDDIFGGMKAVKQQPQHAKMVRLFVVQRLPVAILLFLRNGICAKFESGMLSLHFADAHRVSALLVVRHAFACDIATTFLFFS
jgi:hypothetical protein